MRFTTKIAVGTLMVSSALASPVIVYETEVEHRTVTVFVGASQQTSAPVPAPAVPAPAPPAVSVPAVSVSVSVSVAAVPAPTPSPSHSHSADVQPAVVNIVVSSSSSVAPPPPPPSTTLAVVASSPAPAPAPSPSPSAVQNVALDSFQSSILAAHNSDRALHSAPALTWGDNLASYAQNYLNNQNCVFTHSGGPYGENIAMGYSSPVAAIAAWYDEVSLYNYATGLFSDATGHFTQVVWKGTQQVGCAQVNCNGREFFACEYYPRGNVIGQFTQNVLQN